MKNIILYVEGPTDEEFYNKLLKTIRNRLPNKKYKDCSVKVQSIDGIGRFSNKLLAKYKREVMERHKKEENIVFLCYDKDVFEHGVHPPIDRNKIAKKLKDYRASEVLHIVAEHTIEDWIMIDKKGVLAYLKLNEDTKIVGKTGLEQLKFLFKKANRTYIKGAKVSGLIEALNMDVICNDKCKEISQLCKMVGYDCPKCSLNKMKKLVKS